jgi:putative ABC transport system substrate-binding protein
MKRRHLFLSATGALLPGLAFAQPARKVWRIGFLANGAQPQNLPLSSLGNFPRGMQEHGLVEGRDYTVEWRFSEGKSEKFASMAEELVRMKMDVLIAATVTGIKAAQRATSAIPIVMVTAADPIANGFVSSFAKPGGTITGLSNNASDISAKYLELLRLAVPKLRSVAVWVNPESANTRFLYGKVEAAAKTAGVKLIKLDAKTENQIDSAFAQAVKESASAMIILPDALFSTQARHISELALRQRMPTMYWTREHVQAGGLMSYGQNNAEHYLRAAFYVSKIMKGAKPAELPVEEPTVVELALNAKTAKAIGVNFSQDLAYRATLVIQ